MRAVADAGPTGCAAGVCARSPWHKGAAEARGPWWPPFRLQAAGWSCLTPPLPKPAPRPAPPPLLSLATLPHSPPPPLPPSPTLCRLLAGAPPVAIGPSRGSVTVTGPARLMARRLLRARSAARRSTALSHSRSVLRAWLPASRSTLRRHIVGCQQQRRTHRVPASCHGAFGLGGQRAAAAQGGRHATSPAAPSRGLRLVAGVAYTCAVQHVTPRQHPTPTPRATPPVCASPRRRLTTPQARW